MRRSIRTHFRVLATSLRLKMVILKQKLMSTILKTAPLIVLMSILFICTVSPPLPQKICESWFLMFKTFLSYYSVRNIHVCFSSVSGL